MRRVAAEGARKVLAAIARAWTYERIAIDETNGTIVLLIAAAGDNTQGLARFSPRQAEWISSALRSDVGGFTLRSQNGDGSLELDITSEGHAMLRLGADHPSGEKDVVLPRATPSSELWVRAARQARSSAQTRKDGTE